MDKYDERFEMLIWSFNYSLSSLHLIDDVIENKNKSLLVPSLFNFKHSLELFLKSFDFHPADLSKVNRYHNLRKLGQILYKGKLSDETVERFSKKLKLKGKDKKISKYFWQQVFPRKILSFISLSQDYSILSKQELKDDENTNFKYPSEKIVKLIENTTWDKIVDLRKEIEVLFTIITSILYLGSDSFEKSYTTWKIEMKIKTKLLK